MKNYAKNTLKAKSVKMKCFLKNTASERMIKKAGFAEVSRSNDFIFFEA
jgi:RimJ/RimL family protein N-acetyltransferase